MDEKFDLNELVKLMRQQRPSMIQTPVSMGCYGYSQFYLCDQRSEKKLVK